MFYEWLGIASIWVAAIVWPAVWPQIAGTALGETACLPEIELDLVCAGARGRDAAEDTT